MLTAVGKQGISMAGDISIVAIVKGEERYVFMFDDDTRAETLRTLGRYASDPELSFNWYDAAVLSQKVRKTQTSDEAIDAALVNRSDRSNADSFPEIDFPNPDDIWIGDDPF